MGEELFNPEELDEARKVMFESVADYIEDHSNADGKEVLKYAVQNAINNKISNMYDNKDAVLQELAQIAEAQEVQE